MADQQETIDIDSSEMFRAAMEEPTQEAPAEVIAEQPEQPRDDKGRFAPKQASEAEAAPIQQPPVDQAQPEPKDTDGQVPSWRLREVREAREEAERRAQESAQQSYALQAQLRAMQQELAAIKAPKQEPVDFFANPDQALQQRLSPMEEKFAKLESDVRLAVSRTAAIAMHGAQAVMDMERAIADAVAKNHPDMRGLAAQMRASEDPAGVAMEWHKRTKLWEVTGGDPDVYKNKVLDEALKNPEFLAKALEAARSQAGGQATSRPNINLPPSLTKTPGSSTTNGAADDGDMSDRALFRHAMAR